MKHTHDHEEDVVLDETNNKFDNTSASQDEFILEDESVDTKTILKKLREKIKLLEGEKMEYLSGWQRSKADFVNAKKSFDEDRASHSKFATASLIEDLIPVLQSFDSAMGNKEVWGKVDSAWRMGIEYIYTMLLDVLKQRGVSVIDPLEQPFDPTLHEAVRTEEVKSAADDNKVLAVLQRGYMLHDKVLRGARVVVGKLV